MKYIIQFFAGIGMILTVSFACRVFDWPMPTPVDTLLLLMVADLVYERSCRK